MAEKEKYQGYTNYETFLVCVHIQQNKEQVGFWKSQAAKVESESSETDVLTHRESAVLNLERILKMHFEAKMPFFSDRNAIYYDLLQSALDNVDWQDVADSVFRWLDDSTN